MSNNTTLNAADIAASLALYHAPGEVFEIRIPKATNERGYSDGTVSGYFDDSQKAAAAILKSGYNTRCNIYHTINFLDPALLARAANKLKTRVDITTADAQVQRLCWIPLDIDPKRPAGISSTDSELKLAVAACESITAYLAEWNWQPHHAAISGNGCYLLYRIDLENSPENVQLIERFLKHLASTFNSDSVEIDESVFNPSRILKVLGTMARKGDSIPERPHRLATTTSLNLDAAPVTLDQLKALAPEPESTPAQHTTSLLGAGNPYTPEEIEQALARIGAEYSKKTKGNHTYYELNQCLVHPDHGGKGFGIQLFQNGGANYQCHHNTCAGVSWQDAKAVLWPDGRYGEKSTTTATKKKSKKSQVQPQPAPGDKHHTDYGNAQRLVALYGDSIRYCYDFKNWLVYDGQRWNVDNTGAIVQKTKKTVRQMYAEASQVEDDTLRTRLVRYALRSESAGKIKAMMELAKDEPGVPITPAELDADGWLLNVANGTIDLRTGQLREHRRQDLITKLVDIKFNPQAQAPRWLEFLHTIFDGNQPLIDYMQRVLGYGLTGLTYEQTYWILYGTGQNGKSTLLECVVGMLSNDHQEKNPYALNSPTETILMKKNPGSVSNDIARLKGARIVTVSEVEKGRRLGENLIKQLTGGDTLTARFLHAEFFDFTPECKLFIRANNKPLITETNKATWRRPHLVPFTVQIPDGQVDKKLPQKLRAEWPGILAWLVQGCLWWQRDGLNPPAEVLAATEAYRLEMDVIGQFIAECCVTGEGFKVKAGQLYDTYQKWCLASGNSAENNTVFGRELTARGFIKQLSGGVWRLGIGLVTEDEPTGSQNGTGEAQQPELAPDVIEI